MAVAVYECDTCKRDVHRKQNRQGLDVLGRCVITNGCRGKLLLKEVKPAYAIGHSTDPVIGLTDWSARKVLHTHTQGFLKKTWEIQHGLNNQPSVATYVHIHDKLTRVEPSTITYVTNDRLVLTFPTAVTGVAQLQARSASDGQNITTLKMEVGDVIDATTFNLSRTMPLTNGTSVGELTIAARIQTVATSGFAPTLPIEITAHFISPTDRSEITSVPVVMTFKDVNNTPVDTSASPWGDTSYLTIDGFRYLTRSANIHVGGGIGDTLTDRGIPQGAACYFTVRYNGANRALSAGEILILQSAAPHASVDRLLDEVVDMYDITAENATAMTAYVNLDLLGNTALRKAVYPSIVVL